MKALEKNEIWSATILPTWKRTIRCKRVFTLKYNSGGSIEVYKAWLLLKGFTQAYGILLSLVDDLDWPLHQLDVKNVFLNCDLEEGVYIGNPPGFEEKIWAQVRKLKKLLYGLKQSARSWLEKFTQSVKK